MTDVLDDGDDDFHLQQDRERTRAAALSAEVNSLVDAAMHRNLNQFAKAISGAIAHERKAMREHVSRILQTRKELTRVTEWDPKGRIKAFEKQEDLDELRAAQLRIFELQDRIRELEKEK